LTGSEVAVARLPWCDFHRNIIGVNIPAQYDFKTRRGDWAYGCRECFMANRMYEELGLGKGQRLVIK
jgi:hypothetical protein